MPKNKSSTFFELPKFTDLPLRVPQGLTLYPFQKETVSKTLRFLHSNQSHACYVANEMGLGKSITSSVTASTMGTRRVLIVCPAVMRLTWEVEVYKWCRFDVRSIPRVKTILTSNDVRDIAQAEWVICSYSLASQSNVLSVLASQCYDLLILDEAHAIKNGESKRTRAVIADLWPKCTYKLLLSGTPFTRNIVDCWIPFHNILPTIFPTFQEFVERYSYVRYTKWSTDYYGLKNAEELSKIIRDNFYIRYKKEQVLTELPPKVWQKIELPDTYSVKITAKKREMLYRESQTILDAISYDRPVFLPPTMAEHRRLQGEAKIDAVVEFASDLLEQDIPIVIFAYHKSVVEGIRAKLAPLYNGAVITGETSMADRQAAVEAFQAGGLSYLVCNFIAGGVGITLTRACNCILAELDWTPATINQAVDRLHRITQTNQVTIYYFVVQNSIESTIENMLVSRARDFKNVLDAPSSSPTLPTNNEPCYG